MSTASPTPKIACPHCQGLIKSPGLAAGSLVNCPKCGQAFRIGESAQSPKSKVQGQERGDRGQGMGDKGEIGSRGPGVGSRGPETRLSGPKSPMPPPAPGTKPRSTEYS